MTELLVGTKKGLFALGGAPGAPFEVTARAFAGEPVEYALRDPRSGRALASVTSPFYGPKIWYSDDPGGEWEQAEGVELPTGGESALHRVWVLVPGEEDGTVYAGDALVAPAVTRRLLAAHAARRPIDRERLKLAAQLTDREAEVLHALAEGMSNAEIAGRLFVSEATVKTHVARVLEKLAVRDRVQAVVLAFRTGLVASSGT